jgi:tricorn protease
MAKQRSTSNPMAWLALLAGIAILCPGTARAETRLLRHPTYSNGKVAFSYLGSLWSANDDGTGVQRLTVNKARDIYPSFSPDGKSIAFSSNRAGNYDVYVMPASGDKPRQLTFNSTDDLVIGWTPDGSKIVFISSRDKGVFPGVATLFQVPVDGGMEEPLPTDWGSWASYSPDAKKLAFTRHPGVWSRKHYRGSFAVDLWLMDTASREFTRLGDGEYKGNYFWPMYGNDGSIYFVADRLSDEKGVKYGGPEVMQSVNNIWKISENGGGFDGFDGFDKLTAGKLTAGKLTAGKLTAGGQNRTSGAGRSLIPRRSALPTAYCIDSSKRWFTFSSGSTPSARICSRAHCHT